MRRMLRARGLSLKEFSWSFKGVVLVLFLAFPAVSAVQGAMSGKGIFEGRKCFACHGVATPAKAADEKSGPPLWYAGSKFRAGFLDRWLANPLPLRPMSYGSITVENPDNHPRLSEGEAKEVSAYLMALKAKKSKAGIIKAGRGEARSGGIVFEKKGGCYGCHRIKKDGSVVGGLSGPSLVGAGRRLDRDWIYMYLKDPESFRPKGMPVYKGILEDKEMRALAVYLSMQE
ncbi:MAG: c-type cytochrome [Deltaproteobacteria bacterium]|nr:c-type cytochrome [Deltaproteobacteria bacterium]